LIFTKRLDSFLSAA